MEYKPSFADQLDIDYICHHGIKGMHWGVRRFEDENGHLTPAGKKRYSLNPIKRHFQKKADARKVAEQAKIDAMSPQERKHYYAQKDIDDKRMSYMEDFDETPAGKKALKRYHDAQDVLYSDDPKGDDIFEAAERSYYYKMGDYMVKRMVKEHGYDEVKSYADSQRYPTANSLEERFGQNLWYTHGW